MLVALGILLWGVTWLKELTLNEQGARLARDVPADRRLGTSDEVQVNGMRKGSVSSVALVGDHVLVNLALTSDVTLTNDSRVAIRNVGMMGEKVIAVDLRTAAHRTPTRHHLRASTRPAWAR